MELIRQKVINVIPNIIIIDYRNTNSVDSGNNSGLIEIPLLAPSREQRMKSYTVEIEEMEDTTDLIKLIGLVVICNSDKYTVKIFDKNGLYHNTLHEVLNYTDINKFVSDYSFSTYFIENLDDPKTNNLYLYYENNGTVSTGNLELRLVYNDYSNS